MKILNLKNIFTVSYTLLLSKAALCAETTSTALPYEDWLRTIQKSLTGSVAYSIAIIGMFTCGATLILGGGELNRFVRSLVYLVFAMMLLIGGNSLMSSVFNGATIDENSKTLSAFLKSSYFEIVPKANHFEFFTGHTQNTKAVC